MGWRHVADVADLVDEGVIGRECGGRRIALYRVGGTYYATSGVCTHANACLSDGEVVEGYIECPVHFGLFEIATGRAAGAPVSVDLRTYPVRVEGTRIEIDLGSDSGSDVGEGA